jgi:hypothetical protein
MAVATIGINPAVFIESYQPDPSSKWIGKVANSESNETYSLDRAAFELSEGVIALRLAAEVSRFAKDLVFELHVGHALTQVLQSWRPARIATRGRRKLDILVSS